MLVKVCALGKGCAVTLVSSAGESFGAVERAASY